MTIMMKETGPPNVVRPFRPTIDVGSTLTTDQRQVEALEHIAVSLSAIDHNIEVLTSKIAFLATALAQK